jgi:hypothetical protein
MAMSFEQRQIIKLESRVTTLEQAIACLVRITRASLDREQGRVLDELKLLEHISANSQQFPNGVGSPE